MQPQRGQRCCLSEKGPAGAARHHGQSDLKSWTWPGLLPEATARVESFPTARPAAALGSERFRKGGRRRGRHRRRLAHTAMVTLLRFTTSIPSRNGTSYDGTTALNIEATGHGLTRFDDDYYRQWPFTLTEQEVQAEGYLKSLTPAEEVAVFLSIRGMCLREAGRVREAADAFAAAARLAPNCRSYSVQRATLERQTVALGERNRTPQVAITKEIQP